MGKESVTWALLVPAQEGWLRKRVNKFWKQTFPHGARLAKPWEVIGCEGHYSAVLDRTPGSERAHDVSLIRSLSGGVDGPMYLLYLNEDATLVEVYQGGERQRTLPDEPYDLARRLGCQLPGEPGAGARAAAGGGGVLVEGARKREVVRALRGVYDDGEIPFGVEECPGGVLVYDPETHEAPPLMLDLSEALPDRDVYTIISEPGRFTCMIMRGGEYVGSFDIPERSAGGLLPVPALDSVKGQKTPAAIVRALGIPPDLLGLKASE